MRADKEAEEHLLSVVVNEANGTSVEAEPSPAKSKPPLATVTKKNDIPGRNIWKLLIWICIPITAYFVLLRWWRHGMSCWIHALFCR